MLSNRNPASTCDLCKVPGFKPIPVMLDPSVLTRPCPGLFFGLSLCDRHEKELNRIGMLDVQAIAFLQRAHSLDPNNGQLRQIMQQLSIDPTPSLTLPALAKQHTRDILPTLSRKEFDDRIDKLIAGSKQLADNRDDADTWREQADSLRQSDKNDAALVAYDQALILDSRLVAALRGRALVLRELHRQSEALKSIEQALILDPMFALGWRTKGAILRDLGRHEEGLACYEKGLEIDPGDVMLWKNKRNTLQQLGRSAEALVCFDQLLALNIKYFKRKITYSETSQGLIGRVLGRSSRTVSGDLLIVGIDDRQLLSDWLIEHGYQMKEEKRRGGGSTMLSDGTHHDHYYDYYERKLWAGACQLGVWEGREGGEFQFRFAIAKPENQDQTQLSEWNRLATLLQTIYEQKRS